jgi:hypothetical protein
LGSAILVLVADTIGYLSFAFFGIVFGLLWRFRAQLEMMRLKGRSIRESPWHARWFWWSWWYHRQADEYPYFGDYALPPQG